MVPGFSSGNAHVGFKVVDGPLYNGSDFVKGYPLFGVPLDVGKHAKIYVFINIDGAPFFSSAAGAFAVTDPLSFEHVHFGTDPFVPVSALLFVTVGS